MYLLMKSDGIFASPPRGDLDATQTGSIALTMAEIWSLRKQTNHFLRDSQRHDRSWFESKGPVNGKMWGGYCSGRIQGGELKRFKGIYVN